MAPGFEGLLDNRWSCLVAEVSFATCRPHGSTELPFWGGVPCVVEIWVAEQNLQLQQVYWSYQSSVSFSSSHLLVHPYASNWVGLLPGVAHWQFGRALPSIQGWFLAFPSACCYGNRKHVPANDTVHPMEPGLPQMQLSSNVHSAEIRCSKAVWTLAGKLDGLANFAAALMSNHQPDYPKSRPPSGPQTIESWWKITAVWFLHMKYYIIWNVGKNIGLTCSTTHRGHMSLQLRSLHWKLLSIRLPTQKWFIISWLQHHIRPNPSLVIEILFMEII